MSERLTKEREAEIRARLEIGRLPVLGTALDAVAELLAELDAVRAERDEARADVEAERKAREKRDELLAAHMHVRMLEIVDSDLLDMSNAADRAQKAEARVRELEAERDNLRRTVEAALSLPGDDRVEWVRDCLIRGFIPSKAMTGVVSDLAAAKKEADEATAEAIKVRRNLAETRAQLARLREAAEAFVGVPHALVDGMRRAGGVISVGSIRGVEYTLSPAAFDDLRTALSTPGPTLAEMRAEALEEAAERVEAAAAGTWITGEAASALIRRQRADELEAGRG